MKIWVRKLSGGGRGRRATRKNLVEKLKEKPMS
jgi:hypothetical protein